MIAFPAEALGALFAQPPREIIPVDRGGTESGRWIVRADSGSAFVKCADTPMKRGWLRDEMRAYAGIRGTFMPRLLGSGETPALTWLAIEDLSGAAWPPPWSPAKVRAVRAALAELAAHPHLPGAPRLQDLREGLAGWTRIAADPGPFLSLGMASRAWLDRALPVLLRAEAAAVLDGPALLHCDVRSDNLCFVGDRAVLVDWNWACIGNPAFDLGFWASSLHAEGGPPPEDLLGHQPEVAAFVAGYFAANAGIPANPVPQRVRDLQRFQLTAALPWAVRALGLTPAA